MPTPTRVEIVETFIRNELLGGATGGPIAQDASLVDVGALESLKFMSLVAFLEAQFGVTVPDEQLMDPANFRTLADIDRMLARLSP